MVHRRTAAACVKWWQWRGLLPLAGGFAPAAQIVFLDFSDAASAAGRLLAALRGRRFCLSDDLANAAGRSFGQILLDVVGGESKTSTQGRRRVLGITRLQKFIHLGKIL